MEITVKLFAAARQAAGSDAIEVRLSAAEASVGDLRVAIAEQYPALAEIVRHVMFAVDTEYADDRSVVKEDAEVAMIPPVSGG